MWDRREKIRFLARCHPNPLMWSENTLGFHTATQTFINNRTMHTANTNEFMPSLLSVVME